ncbi:putative pyridine nucleotide-disulfide oxidoreductase [Microdochium trichocladiopsis]|uniref:Pyridine nucleotide-disulfide oxidoreductase n=1 Tax=Microdochium trichocladiopsis TaxID=1682393 RepID=A0A9P9BV01_9PEZI|nr:putative pyridine nucleotide-disulfide oxidoreductase [Microdochium trichocladiopsis]KAH7037994.1 putative pyridine nucleotide-disulfide oxidoreductase [Microdochium trichocladiopsis]
MGCSISKGSKKERVVILGSGWAGYGFARTLDPKKYERIMISPRSYFVFTPLLAGTAVGTLEFRATLESVRRLGLDHFHQGWADEVDFARKTIRVEANTSDELGSSTTAKALKAAQDPSSKVDGAQPGKGVMFDVPYDKLVIAVGAYSQTFGIEGVKEHASFLRDVGDARKIRMKVLQNFERAALPTTSAADRKKLLHFAIVGGGPTGIEFAAELHDLVKDDLTRTYPDLIKHVGITVYDVAPKVLPMFDKTLATYAMETFKREGIAVKTEHHLQRIRPDEDCQGCLKLKIQEYGDEEVGAGIVVWSTGLMQNPLVSKLVSKEFETPELGSLRDKGKGKGNVMIQKDARTGGIVTDSHLRVQVIPAESKTNDSKDVPESSSLPDVFTIGDCAVIPGSGLPATAQVASQQATYLAKQLSKGALNDDNNKAAKPFKFRNWGTMTYLGSWTAIHQSSADELKGWAAWVLWRTAYLTKSMSIRNKIMVPVYWATSWLFGRDISRF